MPRQSGSRDKPPLKVVLSSDLHGSEFVRSVASHLRQQPGVWADLEIPKKVPTGRTRTRPVGSRFRVVFNDPAEMEPVEPASAYESASPHSAMLYPPSPEAADAPPTPLRVAGEGDSAAMAAAQEIVQFMGSTWVPVPFDYEKAIVEAYVSPDDRGRHVEMGLPVDWPQVEKLPARSENPLSQEVVGMYRPEGAEVVVDARLLPSRGKSRTARPRNAQRLTFREAGPRARLHFPNDNLLMVGILVSGGNAPGTNAIIESIICRQYQYVDAWNEAARANGKRQCALHILGYLEGFRALLERDGSYRSLERDSATDRAHEGGSILGTSRAPDLLSENPKVSEPLMEKMVGKLVADNVDILYVIGGDGTMRAAHALHDASKRHGHGLSIVGIPKTTDNDILWAWQSVGLASAVSKASQCLLDLHVEIKSNPRLCVVQLPGSNSGFVVGNAVLAAGRKICDAALIPEVPFSMKALSAFMLGRLQERLKLGDFGARPYGMVVTGETCVPEDYEDHITKRYVRLDEAEREAIREFVRQGRRVLGPTPEALRTGVLKMISDVLQHDIRTHASPANDYWQTFPVFTNSPRNLIRAVPPGVTDVIAGQRLGTLAVDNAMAGYTDFMVSQWLTEYVLVPLRLVVLGRKRARQEGIFWKSVLNATDQHPALDGPGSSA